MVSYKSVFLEIEKKKNPNLITAFALFFTPLLTQPETAAKAKGKQDLEAKQPGCRGILFSHYIFISWLVCAINFLIKRHQKCIFLFKKPLGSKMREVSPFPCLQLPLIPHSLSQISIFKLFFYVLTLGFGFFSLCFSFLIF